MSFTLFRQKKIFASVSAAVLAALLSATAQAAPLITASQTGLALDLDSSSGKYQLSSQNPAWSFGGSLHAALKNVATNKGHDSIGAYRQVSFEWVEGKTPMQGQIRLYEERPLSLFVQTCGAATEVPPSAFPDFTSVPEGLHIFSYGLREFAPPRFSATEISTPWLLFDDQANAFLISPASHFFVASMNGDGQKQVASGFNPRLKNLPAGFSQQTLIALGKGINATWERWGNALVTLQGSKRPANDADPILKYLGYWTDNGASYYYNYDLGKGYANTLQELVNRYREEQIPIRYLQLDSWWYYKTTTDADGKQGKSVKAPKLPPGEWNRYGGLMEYKAHTNLFPNGLDTFQKAIGLPLVTHNRWVDPASPYCKDYKISGVAAVDPKWWDNIGDYLHASGIITYEQDWLDRIYTYSPEFSSSVDAGEAFSDNMSRACKERGITVQYCMPYPCYFLQGSRYENLTTIRTSGDRFNRNRWNDFLYTSRLASCMGIWPWADVYMSSETGNLLLSTLSAGAVGIGDLIGAENKTNILKAVRADGMIIKPDAPIVPMDQCYINDALSNAAPLLASTYTDHTGLRTEYLFAFNRRNSSRGEVRLTPSQLGFTGSAYVYDFFSGGAERLKPDAVFHAPVTGGSTGFWVVAPIGKSGIAFLGDQGKFVGTGKQRITSIHDESGRLAMDVLFADKETSATLHGYADSPPRVTTPSGQVGAVAYDSTTHHFAVEVKPDPAALVENSTGDPVRRMPLLFETNPKSLEGSAIQSSSGQTAAPALPIQFAKSTGS
jgi:hypothetical protein